VALAPEPLAPRIIEPGLGATEVLPAEVKANRRHAVALCALAGALPAVVIGVVLALVLSWLIGVVALVVVEFVIGYGLWRVAPGVALRQVGAVQISERDNPRLFNVTDGLCATFGLRLPDLYVVYDAVPNACALGRDAASAALVVTSGLLQTMGPIELEGVIAHELAHVKRDDNGVSVIGLTLARFGGAGLLRTCVEENREYRADIVGASAVRFPRGLLDALRLMELAPEPAGNSVFSSARFPATRYVWIDPSVGHRDQRPAVGDLDATSVRAAALSEW
jgi:Zn-dependent protease with chaperone function